MVESAQPTIFYPVDRESGAAGCIFFTHILLGADTRVLGTKYFSTIIKLFNNVFK